ncbi:Crp/Fnr family transcriptional regulator [Pedobacter sp. UBA5917]|jgi:hypothetical protein|uniref:Crp/Fnr family transcriptional regulator n=1 Tax=Pedobacter sp. UBA5917 TaxID=1947061 RepID=UPI0025CCDF86|nr:Crp/Fnr family transcriptional regulator [Pedobacter sp. UBA5917]
MNIENIYGEDKWTAFGGFSPLITIFKSYHPLSPEIEDIINTYTFPVRFGKNKHIASPLKQNRYIYLILEGAVHGYLKMGNKKITTWIVAENELAGTIRNLWENEVSDEYIETIDPVFAIAIPHEMSKLLYENFPIANYVGRKMTEIYFQGATERAYICRLPTALKRYQRFLVSYPHLINRVPLKYVASFIGMRLETLSRIRKQTLTETDK